MKKIYLLLLFLAANPVYMQAQTTVQIGTGTLTPTNTLYSPVYRFSATSTTVMAQSNIVFTAAELATAGIPSGATITAVAFNKTNAFNFLIPATYSMLMDNSSAAPPLPGTMATEWPIILTTHTVVYNSSSFNMPGVAGWFTINLTTPFVYTGGSLEIATDQVMTGGGTGATGNFAWEYTTGFATSIIGAATGNSNLATYKQRPNIRITYTTGPLSTGLTSFNARMNNGDVHVAWNIADDRDHMAYQVERSADGETFAAIGTVEASGTQNAYNFVDKNVHQYTSKDIFYYRLRMLEKNGSNELSNTATVRINGKKDMVTVYPNPFSEYISVTAALERKTDVQLQLYDLAGKCVYQQTFTMEAGVNTMNTTSLDELATGVYQAIVVINGERHISKVIK